MPKYKKQEFNGNRPVRKSEYSEDRECYMDSRGNYVYNQWVKEGKNKWVLKPICTIPVGDNGENAEWTILLDNMDVEEDRQNNLIRKHCSSIFEEARADSATDDSEDENDLDIDPWDLIPSSTMFDQNVFNTVGSENEGFDSINRGLMTQLLSAMDKLSPAQRDLIYDHFGARRQLEEIRREEEKQTGKPISQQGMYSRWDKIMARLCKELGVPKPRKKRKNDD